IAYNNPVAPSKDAIKFLFVGNSTTYFNGIPIKFKGLCQAAGVEVVVDYCTNGSAFLSEFADANHERGKKFRNMLNAKEYDYVVLQDAAGAGYNAMEKAVGTMLPLIEKNGATPLLYMRYSNDLDPETRVDSFYKHYLNYSRLSVKYDIDYAPVSGAFLKCIETNPEINLFADDGGHHSWEGSYLAACTWLYSYLGKDPRGNSYTANLPAATATALQNIAYEIAKNGYPFPGSDITKTVIDGVTYENLSLNKPYTSSGGEYTTENWTDGPGTNPLGKFTNGYGAIGIAGDSGECACFKGKEVSITIDLGKLSKVKQICADLYGNTGWGIPSTKKASLKVAFSADGKNFTEAVAVTDSTTQTEGNWERRDFVITFADMIEARYVRVDYVIDGNFLWGSEISVYGTSETQNEPDVSEPDVSEDEVSEDEVSEAPEVSEEQESSETPEVSEENSDVSVAPEASEPADEDTDSSSETSEPAVSDDSSATSGDKGNTGVIVACVAAAVCAVAAVCAFVFFKKKK
ncbi:MAG: discoidin domain-containing protein, partial [Clostridia bacterium]|nr:discoidin domain-containing protein [Clostridia bacterium]